MKDAARTLRGRCTIRNCPCREYVREAGAHACGQCGHVPLQHDRMERLTCSGADECECTEFLEVGFCYLSTIHISKPVNYIAWLKPASNENS